MCSRPFRVYSDRNCRRQLESSHCIVDGVEDGAQAIEAVVKAGFVPYDCILMDCEMVRMLSLSTRVLVPWS